MARTLIMRTQEGKILHLECHGAIASTHELARYYAGKGYTDGYVVFSEKQTRFSSLGAPLSDGKGERGVYLSCILRANAFEHRVEVGILARDGVAEFQPMGP